LGANRLSTSSAAPPASRRYSKASRRPRTLLAVDIYLLGLLLVLLFWLLGSLFVTGFLADPGVVPPFVIDAQLDIVRAVAAFGLPLVLVGVTAIRVRFADRVTFAWTPMIAAWLIVAFAEWVIASADFTAGVLLLGAFPAVVIAHEQDYLRREAGQPPEDVRWSPLRRRLIALIALIVVIWVVAYIIAGVLGINDMFGPLLPQGFPRAPVRAGGG
jgi:hypothetical protein